MSSPKAVCCFSLRRRPPAQPRPCSRWPIAAECPRVNEDHGARSGGRHASRDRLDEDSLIGSTYSTRDSLGEAGFVG